MSIRRKIFCFGGVDALLASVTTYKLADYIYCREPDPSFLETILQTLGLQKVPEPVCPTSFEVIQVVVGWIVLQIIFVVFYRKKSVVKDTMVQSVQIFISDTSDVSVASPVDTIDAAKNVRASVSEGIIFFNEVSSEDIDSVEKNAIESVSEGRLFFNEIEPEGIGSVEKNAIEKTSLSEGIILLNVIEPADIGNVEERTSEDLSFSSDDTAGYASDDCNTGTDAEVESLWLESETETSNASVSNIITKHDSKDSSEKDFNFIQEKDNPTEWIQTANTKDGVEEIKDEVLNPSVALEQNANVSRRDIDDYFEDNVDEVDYASDFAEETTESDDEVLWIPTKTSADEDSLNRNDRPEWSQTDLHCLDVGTVKEHRDTLTERGEEEAIRPETVSVLQKLEETSRYLSCPTQNKLSAVHMEEKEDGPQSFHGMRSESDFGYTSDLSEDEIAQASGGSGGETDPELEAIWLSSLEVDANTHSSSTPKKNLDVYRPSIHTDFFDSKGYGIENKDINYGDELQLSSTSSESGSKCYESSFGVNSNMKESWRRNFTEDIDPDDEYLVHYEKSDDSEDETDVLNQERRLPTLVDDFEDHSSAPFESSFQTDPNIDLLKNVPKCVGCGSYFATWRIRNCAACRKPPKHPNICSNKKRKLSCK